MNRMTTISRMELAVIAGLMVLTGGILLWLGRVPWCECGYVKLWHGDSMSSENSQHIADWYTPSHIVHGFLFYALLHWAMARASLGRRVVVATVIELAWEVVENTEAMINRYREVTIALGYRGDSVLNPMSDAIFMLIGFFAASRLPVWASVAVLIGLELLAGLVIRDNLGLNILMLLYPIDAIKEWQFAV
jgi:hypothetical protein